MTCGSNAKSPVVAPNASGSPMMDLVRKLYPMCRSITGSGTRATIAALQEWIPLQVYEVPSGTEVFDWTVPKEWNIRDAFIADVEGNRVVDFRNSNLHVLNYSIPVRARVSRETLQEHLYSLPEQPDLIPYRTSYYSERWGFCVSERQRNLLTDDEYEVCIDSSLTDGSLSYAEAVFPGDSQNEVLFYTHICHPSLCNDNLSGIAVAAGVGRWLAQREERRYTYRLVFGPGTIGSITWLSRNRARLDSIAHGLVLGLLGDKAPHTYKKTRSGDAKIDQIVEYVLEKSGGPYRIRGFSPYGYDERQFGSPGIALPVGRLTRSENGEYPEYHTSADNLDMVAEDRLQESLRLVCEVINILENDRRYRNLEPYCEPQLGRRGLYRSTGGADIGDRESAMLWLLNRSDGASSLLDIALESNVDFASLVAVAEDLKNARLLQEQE